MSQASYDDNFIQDIDSQSNNDIPSQDLNYFLMGQFERVTNDLASTKFDSNIKFNLKIYQQNSNYIKKHDDIETNSMALLKNQTSNLAPTIYQSNKNILLSESHDIEKKILQDLSAIAVINIPDHYKITGVIKTLKPFDTCDKIILLTASPNDVLPKTTLIVLCLFRLNDDALRFSSALSSKTKKNMPENCLAFPVNIISYVKDIYELSYDNKSELFPSNHTENHESNPCPVCLEKLIEFPAQHCIITILCRHSFHASCLLTWGENRCPVCRHIHNTHLTGFTQSESILPVSELHSCNVCQKEDDLWLCLICGYKGCGRKYSDHASSHATILGHRLSLELSTRSVFDLASHRHIHSLSQPPVDFSPRLFPYDSQLSTSSKGNSNKSDENEQIILLKAQLESQRSHYEVQLKKLAIQNTLLSSQISEIEKESRSFGDDSDGKDNCLSFLQHQIIDRNSEAQNLEAEITKYENSLNYYKQRGDNLAVQLAKEKLELGQIELSVGELESTLSSRMQLLG